MTICLILLDDMLDWMKRPDEVTVGTAFALACVMRAHTAELGLFAGGLVSRDRPIDLLTDRATA